MWQKLFKARKASVITVVAMSSLAIIAMAAFSINLGSAYSALSQDQRVADVAAYSGALAYNNAATTASVNNAVSRIATLNGLSSTAITASMTSSPAGNGNTAILASVSSSTPLYFASALGAGSSIALGASSYAQVQAAQGGVPGCITAIQTTGTGISVTGGTSITAATCAVASNGTVTNQTSSFYTTCGTTITTGTVDYASANVPVQNGCTTIKPPGGTSAVTMAHVTSTDQLKSNPEITAAVAQLATATAVSSPTAQTVSGGTAISLAYSSTPSPNVLPAGCTATFANPTWTITCSGQSRYTFGTITLGGGITLNLNYNTTAPMAASNFYFNGNINGTSGSAINLGAGNYTVTGGILASGSLAATWQGGGTFKVGTTSASPCPTSGYSICTSGSGRVIIPGPSNFTLAGGIYQGASGMPATPALTLGAGSTANSYTIGKGGDGYSINNSNGSTILGDSTTSGTNFSAAGNILSAGGTCIALPASNQHYINGSLNASGGVALGAGTYTIAGYAAFGASSGGNVGNCPASGTSTGVGGLGVTLVLGGATTVTCSGISNTAFCLGAGYSSVNLVAPTGTATLGSNTAGLAVVGPTSSTVTAGAVFSSGATNTRISGVFYFPYGAVTINGGAAVQDTVDSNACLEMVGASITLSGGGLAGTTCTGANGLSLVASQGTTSAGKITIVQ